MSRTYRMKASSLSATYNAGTFTANSHAEAVQMAKDAYRNSPMGRQFGDVGAFRFYEGADEDCDCDDD